MAMKREQWPNLSISTRVHLLGRTGNLQTLRRNKKEIAMIRVPLHLYPGIDCPIRQVSDERHGAIPQVCPAWVGGGEGMLPSIERPWSSPPAS
ncbi:Heterokaryon incompatibility protein 6, OR allele [Fusarium oxysporum f. sp. albedinis]|nr:Heterokaryon incompatibility protein 6, OR allele [Fusarium oxysporum f. sp. albedinis]